jgi:hypothetical protein
LTKFDHGFEVVLLRLNGLRAILRRKKEMFFSFINFRGAAESAELAVLAVLKEGIMGRVCAGKTVVSEQLSVVSREAGPWLGRGSGAVLACESIMGLLCAEAA